MKGYDDKILDDLKQIVIANHEKNESKKKYRKVVRGRMKLAEGKKARHQKKGATDFENELEKFLKSYYPGHHIFRSPSSKSPVDVWRLEKYIKDGVYGTLVHCYQCKTTLDTDPPKIDKKEFVDFQKFCNQIGAKPYWVDRWKKNKGKYIRRIRGIDIGGDFYSMQYDFSLIKFSLIKL